MISRSRLLIQGAARGRLGGRSTVRRITTHHRLLPSSSSSCNVLLNYSPGIKFYSTERILELRTGDKDAHKRLKTLYDPKNEKENCGVGLIASLKSIPSRDIVEKADEMLVRMAHRGGCGCDPASGDGSGE